MSPIRFCASLTVLTACAGWLQAADVLSLVPSTTTPETGSTVTVAVQLASTGQPVLTSGQVQLSFDPSRLQYVSVTKDANAVSASVNGLPNNLGSVRALLDYGGGAQSSGTVLTVSFIALVSGTTAVQAIDFGPGFPLGAVFFDDAFQEVDVTVPPGATVLTVTDPPVNQAPLVQAGFDQTITLPAPATLAGSAMDDGLPSATLSHLWSKVSGPGVVSFSATTALSTTASFTSAGSYVLRLTTSDGALSGSDEITVQVDPAANLPPTATAQSVGVTEDTAQAITLSGTDSDGTIASYAIVSAPTKGTLSGSGASRTYTPTPDATGADSFTFTVTDDDGAVSAAATVTITIAAVNDPPVNTVSLPAISGTTAVGQTLTASPGTWSDAKDGGSTITFTYQWRRAATATGAATAIPGATGSTYLLGNADLGRFIEVRVIATDSGFPGTASASVLSARTVAVEPAPVGNVAPVAAAQSVGVTEDGSVAITLAGTDPDGTLAGFTIFRTPTKGVLSGTAPTLTYIPDPDATGADSFSFFVTDDQGAVSVPAEVGLTIAPVNDAPVNTALPVITGTVAIGQILTAAPGSWNDAADGNPPPTAFAYQWLRATAPVGGTVTVIPGATASTYALVDADTGFHIGVRVTATDAGTPGTASTIALAARTTAVPPVGTVDQRRILLEPVAGFAWDAAGLPSRATTGNRTLVGPYPSASSATLTVVPQAGG
jgi:hypothetical protein